MTFELLLLAVIIYFAFKAVKNLVEAVRQDGRPSYNRNEMNGPREEVFYSVYRNRTRRPVSYTHPHKHPDIEDAKWVDVS